MLKQVFRAIVISALLLAVASPAWANNVTVILDDPIPNGGGTNPYQLTNNGPWMVSWQGCGNPPVPTHEGASGYSNCLALLNNLDSGNAITTVELSITIPTGLSNITFTCLDPNGAVNNCASIPSVSAGDTVTIDFSNLNIGFPDEFFIGVGAPTDATVPPLGPSEISLPTYDPSTLTLLAVGIAMLAMSGIRRYA